MLNTYQVLSRGHSCSAAGRPSPRRGYRGGRGHVITGTGTLTNGIPLASKHTKRTARVKGTGIRTAFHEMCKSSTPYNLKPLRRPCQPADLYLHIL